MVGPGPVVVPYDNRSDVQSGSCPDDGCGWAFCPNCVADVRHLPPIARFCHRCGFHLPTEVATPILPASPQSLPCGFIPLLEPFPPSLILLAFGRALFNLGFRYETAVGSRRNVEEALRCYQKAARLGDAGAADRLALREGESTGGATPPPLPFADRPSHPPVVPPPLGRLHMPPALPS
jgi:hypothetical protein